MPESLLNWLNENEVAKITSIAVQTLRNDRWQRKGIPYSKIGKNVRYLRQDVEAYMLKRRIAFDDAH